MSLFVQIAFKAALNIEERRGIVYVSLDDTTFRGRVSLIAGHLKDGTPVYFGREP